MRIEHIIFIVFFVTTLSGCGTMEFVNGPKMEETVVRSQWHHLGFNGLVEFSKPVNLDYNCDEKQWDSVTIEQTFFNGLASATTLHLSIYSPWTVVYECREPID